MAPGGKELDTLEASQERRDGVFDWFVGDSLKSLALAATARKFLQEYYHKLTQDPLLLLKFYGDDTVVRNEALFHYDIKELRSAAVG